MSNNKKKLIILGAGASAELDYPTGKELLLLFERYLNQTNNQELLKIIGTDKRSIDTTISHIKDEKTQNEIKQILMFLISMCEKQWALKSEMYSDIISLLMQDLIVEDDNLIFNENIEILTFNYDVSLDIYCKQYLEKALYDGKKTLTQNQTKALRNKIKHIYGSLWGEDEEKYEYGGKLQEFFKSIYKNEANKYNYFCTVSKTKNIDPDKPDYSLNIYDGFVPYRKIQQSIYDSEWYEMALKHNINHKGNVRAKYLSPNLFTKDNDNEYFFTIRI